MKKLLLILAVAFLCGGCRGVNRLLGDNDSPAPVQAPGHVSVLGTWDGSLYSGELSLGDGTVEVVVDITSQSGDAVTGTYTFLVPQSDQPGGPASTPFASGTITGTISKDGAFAYATEESGSCHGTATGSSTGSTMTISWSGQDGCAFWFDGPGSLSR